MQELPFWSGKKFQEVTLDELEAESRKRAEEQNAKVERLREVEEEQSEVFIPPSEVAAEAAETAAVVGTVAAVEMTGRGIDSLTRMDDRDIVDKASKTKHGDKFLALWSGESVLGTEEQNERALMARLAIFAGENTEQLLRIFRASGQFRDSKPNAYYEQMAKDEMKFVAGLKSLYLPQPPPKIRAVGSKIQNLKFGRNYETNQYQERTLRHSQRAYGQTGGRVCKRRLRLRFRGQAVYHERRVSQRAVHVRQAYVGHIRDEQNQRQEGRGQARGNQAQRKSGRRYYRERYGRKRDERGRE